MAPGAGVFRRDPEVEDDGLGMSDMEKPVGFRREAGDNPSVIPPLFLIPIDDLSNEVGSGTGGRARVVGGRR